MSKFRLWYITNQDAITWFLIGVLTAQGINAFINGDYTTAAVNFGIAALNYFLVNFKMKV